jgi:hypothetical protein
MPEMHAVESSVMEAVGYDPARRQLHIRFRDTGLYVYSGVEEKVAGGLLAAESKGAYFNQEIKPRGYPYERRA